LPFDDTVHLFSKTNKWKQSLAQMKQVSEGRTDNNSQLVENDHLPTNKWKQSLAQIKKVSEVPTDNNAQLVDKNYISTSKWKQSLIQLRKMAEAQTDNNSPLLENDQPSTIKQLQNEMEDQNTKVTLNSMELTVRSFHFLAKKGLIEKQQKFVFSLASKMYVELDICLSLRNLQCVFTWICF
jgi:hypothetical protein